VVVTSDGMVHSVVLMGPSQQTAPHLKLHQ